MEKVLTDNWAACLAMTCSSTYQNCDINVLSLLADDDPSQVLAEKWKSNKKSENGSFPTWAFIFFRILEDLTSTESPRMTVFMSDKKSYNVTNLGILPRFKMYKFL